VQNIIALVDDNKNTPTSVIIALESEGFKVKSYTYGGEAFRILQAAPADLTVLDIKMPRMDSMELLRRICEHFSLPVTFLTSKDDEIDEILGLRMGADDYVEKPCSQRLWIDRIRALLRRGQAVSAGEGQSDRALVRGDLILDSKRHVCSGKAEAV